MVQEHLEKLAEKHNIELPLVRRIISSMFEKTLLSIQEKKSVRLPHIGVFQYNTKAKEIHDKYAKKENNQNQ